MDSNNIYSFVSESFTQPAFEIHSCHCVFQSFILFYCWVWFCSMNRAPSPFYFCRWTSGCFWLVAIMNKAAVNILIQVFLGTSDFLLWFLNLQCNFSTAQEISKVPSAIITIYNNTMCSFPGQTNEGMNSGSIETFSWLSKLVTLVFETVSRGSAWSVSDTSLMRSHDHPAIQILIIWAFVI